MNLWVMKKGYEKGLFNNISVSFPTAIDWTMSVTPVFIKTTDASSELFLFYLSWGDQSYLEHRTRAGATLCIGASVCHLLININANQTICKGCENCELWLNATKGHQLIQFDNHDCPE